MAPLDLDAYQRFMLLVLHPQDLLFFFFRILIYILAPLFPLDVIYNWMYYPFGMVCISKVRVVLLVVNRTFYYCYHY